MKFDWVFRKYTPPIADEPAAAAPEADARARPARRDADTAPAFDWQPQLQAAMGDDTALLALTREAAPIDVKMAAVAALGSEAALKVAEREHRDHDRRVHRLAKQRYLAQVAVRETGESADRLIEAATALGMEPLVAANRLVELDRAWQGLNLGLLDAARRDEFDALLNRLAALTRERGDHTLRIDRWTAEARQSLALLRAACTSAADGTTDRRHLAAAAIASHAVLEAAPGDDDAAALRESLRSALGGCAELDQRLAVLDALLQAPSTPRPETVSPELPANDAPAEPAAPLQARIAHWLALSPLADAPLAEALTRRFEQWQSAREEARQARRTERRERARDREREIRSQRTDTLAVALEHAEAALAAGQLADTHKHLLEIDELVHGGAAAAPLQSRIAAVQAEYTRLKGWQHWGGGLARDELLLQAEALAAVTLGEPGAGIVKLSVRQQTEVIDELRVRWKELDRLGGATSRSHWQRFDAALKTAYGPVAAHLDVQRAARAQNLLARDQLVAALNAVALPDPNEGEARPDWRSLAAALARFQTEWRKLGPLEHTVPHKERNKLVARMDAAVQRLEAPLNEARQAAELVRERLIARARALAAEASGGVQGRDLVGKVRDLQAEWQHHATALPLTRAVENALWTRFKTDIDAIFSARNAVFNARDAEFKTHGAERAALIERLATLAADAPPAEIKRTLAEVDAQWQRAGPAPRADAAALDAQFRRARDAARRQLDSYAQRSWHATCDALTAKLALCEAFEREPDNAKARATLEQRWPELPVLPPLWEQALARRASPGGAAGGGQGPGKSVSADDLLLRLEAAFQLASPAAFETVRRDLKLQAMKAALESRRSAAPTPLGPEQLLAAALERTALDDAQRERLAKVIAALRNRGPSSTG
ncbi:MAG: DUF349 domain-containing protein [Caldimonas sp.]